ncbi:MAG: hypothetical protein LBU15_04500 [Rickettsiales bacterium]|jgi:hypothetical protein|nr:hypothetical protein [Rickettsiales bacterium]
MTEDQKKNRPLGLHILISALAVVAALVAVLLLLSLDRKNIALRENFSQGQDSLRRKMDALSERAETLAGKIMSLENRMDEVLRGLDAFEGRLAKLENHTVERQDRNIKILMNLNRIQRALEVGENFSGHLRLLEQLCSSDGRLRGMVDGLSGYEDLDLSDAEIRKTFDVERAGAVEKHGETGAGPANVRGRLMKFLENNIRVVKATGAGASEAESPLTLAARDIDRRDYRAFLELSGGNGGFSEIFRETLKIVAKRVELNKLIDNLFRAIYNL